MQSNNIELIIISGQSGSGKSIALQTLEDEGFFCVDNLPLSFLPEFMEKIIKEDRTRRLAVVIDGRGFPDDLANTSDILKSVRKLPQLTIRLLFLATTEEVLINRYSNTRRRHPLALHKQGLIESIAYENRLIEPLRQESDITLDTSLLNVHQLRAELKLRLFNKSENSLLIQIESFGFRNGVPLDADFIFDARVLTNPHWVPHLREYSGLETPIEAYFEEADDVQEYYHDLKHFFERWIPRFQSGTRSYLSIAIGCTGGKHRSVYLVNRLYHALKERYTITAKHRELERQMRD